MKTLGADTRSTIPALCSLSWALSFFHSESLAVIVMPRVAGSAAYAAFWGVSQAKLVKAASTGVWNTWLV